MIYTLDESMKNRFPSKPVTNIIEDEIEYAQQLIAVIEQGGRFASLPKVGESLNLLKETIVDDVEHLQTAMGGWFISQLGTGDVVWSGLLFVVLSLVCIIVKSMFFGNIRSQKICNKLLPKSLQVNVEFQDQLSELVFFYVINNQRND